MKVAARDIPTFLTRPSAEAAVILIYGPDAGLVQERASQLIPKLIADSSDPMAVVTMAGGDVGNDPMRFMDEAYAVSLLGPAQRILRIHGADDSCTPVLKDYVARINPDVRILVIAGNLTPKSSLRLWAEKERYAVALPCYVEGEQEAQTFIAQYLRDNGLQADRDVTAFLAGNLVGDRLVMRRQLEKLVVFKGPNPSALTIHDVEDAIPDLAQKSLDDLVYAAYDAQWPELFRTLDSMLAENLSFMLILRTLQNHARRLEIVHERIADGQSQSDALKALYPPVFFKVENRFKAQLNQWPMARINQLQGDLLELEASLKTYGADMTGAFLGQWFLTHMGSRAKAA